ncbi:putative response regulatory protein [Clostridium puniceum]|uniref:Stage 0 sporulation protein A homolog n=1 Tax=Clostridium puniceum TaxID=29367 RepID=A0A1S8TXQ6_9CLOT|nr:response regulator [Clostridium puniceum]OOM82460.1 putative response regulatory protein [Clostridium puniceum]
MLNVLIIDDEPNVRLGLRKIMPWQENGFQVCGEGQDAEDGFEKIMTLLPDIVLIDIKLPGKLGTDVIKEAREAGYVGKFIIVSGYSNFEYAKTGIKYGVKSYILKPVDEDELIDLLLQLKTEIENEKLWQQEKKIVQYTKLHNFILDENDESLEEDNQIKEEYSKYEKFRVALISEVDGYDKKIKLEELVKEQLKSYGDVDVIKIDMGILILFKDFNNKRINSIASELKGKLSKKLHENIFITIGCEVNNIRKIKQSYKEAKKLLIKRFLFLEKGIISKKSVEKIDMNKSFNFDTVVEKIYSYVEISDVEKIISKFRDLEKLVIQRNYSEEQIKVMCIKIFLDLKQKLNSDYDEIAIKANEEIIENIYSQISLKHVIDYLIENFNNIANQIGGTSSDNIIKRVINYMNTNYYKDLKLEILAEIFNYNSAYLGKLFKSNVGENFNTYLDKIRIEKAKCFLVEEKLKVYQVCEKVGYKNIDYFHSKFKKYVGTSPLNYKKQCDEEM